MVGYKIDLKKKTKAPAALYDSPGSVAPASSPLPSALSSPVPDAVSSDRPQAQPLVPPSSTSPGSVASGSSTPPSPVSLPQSFEDIVSVYTRPPISQEEEERRKRGASAVEAVGHLGNVLSSLSNLIFTGKGAPSQRLPVVPDAGLQKFEDRVSENRRRYVSQILAGRQMDEGNKARAAQLEWQRQKEAADRQEKIEQRAYDLMKFKEKMTFEQAREQARREEDEARRNETERHNREQESIGRMNAQTSRDRLNQPGKRQDYGKYHFTTRKGVKSRDFDLNKDADVLAMYREGVRGGIYPEIKMGNARGKVDVKQLRNYILYKLGKQSPTKSILDMESLPVNGLGWGSKNNNNETDW